MGNFYFPAPPYPNRPRFKVWAYGYMSVLTLKNEKVGLEIVPYKQDFDGVHILCKEELSFFNKYLNQLCLPIANDELLQKYYDAWCIKASYIARLKYFFNLENCNFADVKNILCCEAHNDVLKNEAMVNFDKNADAVRDLISDIDLLQEMKILDGN